MKIKLSKIETAEIQLNEAVYLFFSQAHPVVIETLVGATIGILRDVGKTRGVTAPLHDSDKIKPEYKNVWISHLRKAQNFAKHADRDPEEILEYETKALPFRIYEACHLYRHLASNLHLKHKQSNSAILFEIWFAHKYPHLLNDTKGYFTLLKSLGLTEKFSTDNYEMFRLITEKYRITGSHKDT